MLPVYEQRESVATMNSVAQNAHANAQAHLQAPINTVQNPTSNTSLGMNADASQFAPYAMSGGRTAPRKTKRVLKASPKKPKPQRKIFTGPSGGKYYLKMGRKVYLC